MKYNIDFDFFKRDSSDLWYFIGFFYADGCIYKTKASITLHKIDCECLKKMIRKFSTHTIYNKKNYCSWEVSSKYLCFILQDKFGLTPRKSLTIKFPNNIPQEYIWDFIRGYFDGDGSVGVYDNHGLCVSIVSGCENFLIGIKNTLSLNNIICNVRFDKSNTWKLYMSAENGKMFGKQIYKKECLALERKKQIFTTYKDKNDYMSITDLSQIFNVNKNTITRQQKKFNMPFSYENGSGKYYSEKDIIVWKELYSIISPLNSFSKRMVVFDGMARCY